MPLWLLWVCGSRGVPGPAPAVMAKSVRRGSAVHQAVQHGNGRRTLTLTPGPLPRARSSKPMTHRQRHRHPHRHRQRQRQHPPRRRDLATAALASAQRPGAAWRPQRRRALVAATKTPSRSDRRHLPPRSTATQLIENVPASVVMGTAASAPAQWWGQPRSWRPRRRGGSRPRP
jgi:hypothetical protein